MESVNSLSLYYLRLSTISMADHQHVMYTSKGTVEQVYSELYGDVDHVEIERGSTVTGSVSGKLDTFFSIIASTFSGKLTESEIHSINFNDDMFKAKKLANEILSDEGIPKISEVRGKGLEQSQLYRFSCEVSTKPFESEIDGQMYIEVSGAVNGVKFRGDTSTDNWGSRSHIIQSVRAAGRGDTYPYQGLMWPISKTDESDSLIELDVKYLIICGPERKLMERWYDRMTA